MNKFKERLNRALQENKMSQVELAKKIGMSKSIISKYCCGIREPSLDALILICNALEESADYLLGIIN